MGRVVSGRIKKAKRGKNAPTHQKNYRWESFSTKISKLHSLDPLKKVRRHDLQVEDVSTTTSYFRNGLQRWSELNIAKEFVAFKQATLPISDSLPQILHHEQRIMKRFVQHISAHEKESLEPLLDLLTAFAQDLGPLFEKHYHQSLTLIVDLAGKPQDAEVIEWTFGALAFLFKRLYKLLVPDLRPTYDVLSPLLGKSKHPPHIARFAAEAMSFLIKKAAAPNHRETALPLIIERTKEDLYEVHGTRQFVLFQDGLMTMYAEAIKGPAYTLHSTGPVIFTTLLETVPSSDSGLSDSPLWTNLTCGVLTSLIHHSTAPALAPIVDAISAYSETARSRIVSQMEDETRASISWPLAYLIRVLGTLASVRKGAKVNQWEPIVEHLDKILKSSRSSFDIPADKRKEFWNQVVVSVACVWAHAPMGSLMRHVSSFIETMGQEPFRQWYIPFCAFFADLDSTRFKSLFLTNLKG
jgi:U3 small nucleolar RNA-associated protein 20